MHQVLCPLPQSLLQLSLQFLRLLLADGVCPELGVVFQGESLLVLDLVLGERGVFRSAGHVAFVLLQLHQEGLVHFLGVEELLLEEVAVFLDVLEGGLELAEDAFVVFAHFVQLERFSAEPVSFLLKVNESSFLLSLVSLT